MKFFFYMACRLAMVAGCGLAAVGTVLIGTAFWPVFLVVLFVAARYGRRWTGGGWAFGTARLADARDLLASGLLWSHGGLFLGRCGDVAPATHAAAAGALLSPRWPSATAVRLFRLAGLSRRNLRRVLLRTNQYVHTLVIASTGAGKGVGFVIPNALTLPGSLVVLDLDGACLRATAAARRRRFRQRVVTLAQFGPDGAGTSPDGCNPLDLVRPGREIDDSRMLAVAIVAPAPGERDPHWAESAQLVLGAMITFVVTTAPPEDRHLLTVRQLLAHRQAFQGALALMLESAACGGALAQLAGSLSYFQDKELNSVMTTLGRALGFLDSPAAAALVCRTTFDPDDLARGRLSVYLLQPPEYAKSHAPVVRLLLTALFLAAMRHGPQERHLIHVILDEVQQLGRVEAVESALTFYRKFGIRLILLLQSAGQVGRLVEDPQTLWNNCSTQAFFGLNAGDAQTCELVSARIGDATVTVHNYQESAGTSGTEARPLEPGGAQRSWSHTASHGASETGRRVLQAAEVARLRADQVVLFTPACPRPILAELAPYFRTPDLTRGGRLAGLREAALCGVLALVVLAVGVGVFAAGQAAAGGRSGYRSPPVSCPAYPAPEGVSPAGQPGEGGAAASGGRALDGRPPGPPRRGFRG